MSPASLLLLLIAGVLSGCQDKPDDVTQIRAVIETLADRALAHDVSGMMEHVTDDYTASPGTRDEQSVRPILVLALRRYGKFTVQHPTPGITIADNKQSADASIPFLIVREGQKVPTDLAEIASDPVEWSASVAQSFGDPYQLDLTFRKTPDGWKIAASDITGVKSVNEL